MRVLVTGSRGLLGSHLVPSLRREHIQVRTLDRSAGSTIEGVETVQADLTSGTDLTRALQGVDTLVHLAARQTGSDEEIHRDTVEGTRRLLAALGESECRRIVLVSSFSVYDWSRMGASICVDAPLLNERSLAAQDGYARAKWRQERLVREVARDRGWDLTVLRPAVIRSDGVDGGFLVGPRLGPLRVVVAPRAKIRVVHVNTVVRAIVDALARPVAGETILNVIDAPTWSTWEYAGRLGGLRMPLPYGVGMIIARIASALALGSDRLPYVLQPARFEALHRPVRWSGPGGGASR